MVKAVKWTEAASSDLEQVAEYIAKDSAYYADAFVSEVCEAAQSLTTLAERGHIVAEFSDPHLREIFVKKYRLIYEIGDETIYIMGFIHGAKDLLAHWEEQ